MGIQGKHISNPFKSAILNSPPSTKNRLVFRWSSASKKFDISYYHPSMTENRLSVEELTQINQRLSTAPEGELHSPYLNILKFCPILLLIIFIAAFPIILIYSINSNWDKIWTVFPVAIIAITLLIFLLIAISFTCAGMIQTQKYKKREVEFNKILEEYNKSFQSSEITFRSGKYGAYLLIELEYLMNLGNGPAGGFNKSNNTFNYEDFNQSDFNDRIS